MKADDLVKRFRVRDAPGFRLSDIAPDDTAGLSLDKKKAHDALEEGLERLRTLQEMLYAQDRWGLLVVLQGMDAAGKDGAIAHVMSAFNPQGVVVHAFKQPSASELAHDFLWRAIVNLPERGQVAIFNRSYYEEVLVTRVRPELIERERLPPELLGKRMWDRRFADIDAFERYLTHNGFAVCKIFLHVSKEEQRRRFLERIDDPSKNWKFSPDDSAARASWDAYQDCYQDMIRATATAHAPWYVVPADHKWFARLAVAAVVGRTLGKLGLKYPEVPPERLVEIREAGELLRREGENP
jgi:PPK2 family polyphosphate:nucleotide phosphotransferase